MSYVVVVTIKGSHYTSGSTTLSLHFDDSECADSAVKHYEELESPYFSVVNVKKFRTNHG